VAAIYDSWHNQGDIATYPNFKDKDTYGSISNGTNSLYLERWRVYPAYQARKLDL
jgi:hypothetical protein